MFFDVDLTDEYARSGMVNGAVSNYWEELREGFHPKHMPALHTVSETHLGRLA